MWNRLSPHMRAFLLPVVVILIICAVMWVPAEAKEPRLVREIAFVPCEGSPVYIFVFDTGSVALFDLVRVTRDAGTREIFVKLIDRAKAEVTKKEVVLRQKCDKPDGAGV